MMALRKKILHSVFFLVPLLVGVVVFFRAGLFDLKEDLFLYSSYRSGSQFYSRTDTTRFDSDEKLLRALIFEGTTPFLRGEGRSGSGDPFRKILGEELRSLRVFSSLRSEPKEGRMGYPVSREYERFLDDPWDDVMLRVLYCDTYGFPEDEFRTLASVRSDGGYADTHKLLALLLLRENDCSDGTILDRTIDEGSRIIAAAAGKNAVWSDLFAERIVFLYWAGRGDLVKSEWIKAIVSAQREDGGWADPGFGDGSNPHSTGLALLSIRYFLEGKTSQEFFGPLDR